MVTQVIYVTEEDQSQHKFVGLVTMAQMVVCVLKVVKVDTLIVQLEHHCTVVL